MISQHNAKIHGIYVNYIDTKGKLINYQYFELRSRQFTSYQPSRDSQTLKKTQMQKFNVTVKRRCEDSVERPIWRSVLILRENPLN